MIVDMHTHVFDGMMHLSPHVLSDMERCHVDISGWQSKPERHVEATAAADRVVVFGLLAKKTGWNIPNEFVKEHVDRHPERMIFFASIDPLRHGFMRELEKCHESWGCRGVKLAPVYQGVHPLDKRYREIYRYCERRRLPIIMHMGTTFSSGVPLEYSRPAHLDSVAVDFPHLKLVIAHMGHPWEGETIAAIRKQPNLFADISALYYRPWQFYQTMRLLVEYHAEEKVLFGSDYPATTTADSIAGLRGLNAVLAGSSGPPPVPAELIERIIHQDALRLLEIAP